MLDKWDWFKIFCTSSIYSVPVQKTLYQGKKIVLQHMPFERGGQQCIFIYSYNIFSSNIMLIPSLLSKKIR